VANLELPPHPTVTPAVGEYLAGSLPQQPQQPDLGVAEPEHVPTTLLSASPSAGDAALIPASHSGRR